MSTAKRAIQSTNTEMKKLKEVQNKLVRDVASEKSQMQKFMSAEMATLRTLIQGLQKSSVQLVKGRIPQPLLPGSYATVTLEDVGWHTFHAAAASACLGTSSQQGVGTWMKYAMPGKSGETCERTCRRTHKNKKCKASVSIRGNLSKMTNSKNWAAEYKQYSCKRKAVKFDDETVVREDAIWSGSIVYCCCSVN